MRFYPSSYGGSQRGALREENPCHEPGGKASGGQFAKKGSTGCTDATVASTGQPMLADTKTGHPKFEQRPDKPDKQGLQIERPKDAKKKADATGGEKVTMFDDENGNADEALEALGVRMSAEDIAKGMVSAVEGETFRVTVTTNGESSGETYDGPDPDSVRSQYDDYQMDAMSEAESSMHDSERDSYDRYSEDAFYTAADLVNSRLAAVKGEDSFAKASVWDKATIDLTDADKDAINHTEALAEKIFDPDSGVVNEEGFKARGAGEKVQAIVDKYLADNPDAKFVPLPVTGDDSGGGFLDEDYRREHSKYFNDRNGYDNWRDDGQGDSAGEDIPSFESWYEDRYGHSPDKYGQSSGSEFGEDSSVEFSFRGSKGSQLVRTVSIKDGELHVHHDLFRAGGTGDGLSKQFFQGALPTYDKMGVKSLSTYADIDIGAYTWGRYGFVPDSPGGLARRVTARAKELFKDTGLFDDADWRAFQSVVDPKNPEFIWDVVDAKYYTTPDRAQALVGNWMRHDARASVEISNKKTREEAKKGIVSVGRLTMIDDAGAMNWEAHLDLHDEDSVKRLEGYVGVWRDSRQGFRADPTPAPPRTVRPPDVSGPGKHVPDIGTFNNQYAALQRRAPGVTLPTTSEVFSRMRNLGMSFESAVRSAAAARGASHATLKALTGALAPRSNTNVPMSVTKARKRGFDTEMKAFNKTPLGATLTDYQRVAIRDLMVGQGFNFRQAKSFVIPIGQRDRAAQTARALNAMAVKTPAQQATAKNRITAKQINQFDADVHRWNKTHPPGQGIGRQTENTIWRKVNDGSMTFDAAAGKLMAKRKRADAQRLKPAPWPNERKRKST